MAQLECGHCCLCVNCAFRCFAEVRAEKNFVQCTFCHDLSAVPRSKLRHPNHRVAGPTVSDVPYHDALPSQRERSGTARPYACACEIRAGVRQEQREGSGRGPRGCSASAEGLLRSHSRRGAPNLARRAADDLLGYGESAFAPRWRSCTAHVLSLQAKAERSPASFLPGPQPAKPAAAGILVQLAVKYPSHCKAVVGLIVGCAACRTARLPFPDQPGGVE